MEVNKTDLMPGELDILYHALNLSIDAYLQMNNTSENLVDAELMLEKAHGCPLGEVDKYSWHFTVGELIQSGAVRKTDIHIILLIIARTMEELCGSSRMGLPLRTSSVGVDIIVAAAAKHYDIRLPVKYIPKKYDSKRAQKLARAKLLIMTAECDENAHIRPSRVLYPRIYNGIRDYKKVTLLTDLERSSRLQGMPSSIDAERERHRMGRHRFRDEYLRSRLHPDDLYSAGDDMDMFTRMYGARELEHDSSEDDTLLPGDDTLASDNDEFEREYSPEDVAVMWPDSA